MDPGRHSHIHFLNDTDERKQQKGALILVQKVFVTMTNET